MESQKLLARLARRQGVPYGQARRLRPLLERALAAEEPVRTRLIELVERTLAREADRIREHQREEREREDRALQAIGKLLHRWKPPAGFDAGWLASGGPGLDGI